MRRHEFANVPVTSSESASASGMLLLSGFAKALIVQCASLLVNVEFGDRASPTTTRGEPCIAHSTYADKPKGRGVRAGKQSN